MRVVKGDEGEKLNVSPGPNATYAVHLPTGDSINAKDGIITVRVSDTAVGIYRVYDKDGGFSLVRLETISPLMKCVRCELMYDPLKPRIFAHCRWHPRVSRYKDFREMFGYDAIRGMHSDEFVDYLEGNYKKMEAQKIEGSGDYTQSVRKMHARLKELLDTEKIDGRDQVQALMPTGGLYNPAFWDAFKMKYGPGFNYKARVDNGAWSCCGQPNNAKTLGCFIGVHSFHNNLPDLRDFHNHSRGTEHISTSLVQRQIHAKILATGGRDEKVRLEARFNKVLGGAFYPNQLMWRLDLSNPGKLPGDLPDVTFGVLSMIVKGARMLFEKNSKNILGRLKDGKEEVEEEIKVERGFDDFRNDYVDPRNRRLIYLRTETYEKLYKDFRKTPEQYILVGHGVMFPLVPILDDKSDEEKAELYVRQLHSNMGLAEVPTINSRMMIRLARIIDDLIDSIAASMIEGGRITEETENYMKRIRGAAAHRKAWLVNQKIGFIRGALKEAYRNNGLALDEMISHFASECFFSIKNSEKIAAIIAKLVEKEVDRDDKFIKRWKSHRVILPEAERAARSLEERAFLDRGEIMAFQARYTKEGEKMYIDAGFNKHLLFSCAFSFYRTSEEANKSLPDSLFARLLNLALPEIERLADSLFDEATAKAAQIAWQWNIEDKSEYVRAPNLFGPYAPIDLEVFIRFSVDSNARTAAMRGLLNEWDVSRLKIKDEEKRKLSELFRSKLYSRGLYMTIRKYFVEFCQFYEAVSRQAICVWIVSIFESSKPNDKRMNVLKPAMNRVDDLNKNLYEIENASVSGYINSVSISVNVDNLLSIIENTRLEMNLCRDAFPQVKGWAVDIISILNPEMGSTGMQKMISSYNAWLKNKITTIGGAIPSDVKVFAPRFDLAQPEIDALTTLASDSLEAYKTRKAKVDKRIKEVQEKSDALWKRVEPLSRLSDSFALFCAEEIERGVPESEKWSLMDWFNTAARKQEFGVVIPDTRLEMKIKTVVLEYNRELVDKMEIFAGVGIAPLRALVQERSIGEDSYTDLKEKLDAWSKEQSPFEDSAKVVVAYQVEGVDLVLLGWCLIDKYPDVERTGEIGAYVTAENLEDSYVIRCLTGPYPELAILMAVEFTGLIERPDTFGVLFVDNDAEYALYKSGLTEENSVPSTWKNMKSRKTQFDSVLSYREISKELETLIEKHRKKSSQNTSSSYTPVFKLDNLGGVIRKAYAAKKRLF